MTLILGHGASGTAASMEPWVRALARHDVRAIAIDLPRGNAERALPVFEQAMAANPGAALGGHSYGGRVASMVAATREVDALVLLSYPLHRPGHPEALRTEHWHAITCPVLMLSGESDPFARLDLFRRASEQLADVVLITYPRAGHGLLSRRDEVAPRIAEFLKRQPLER
jgi:predicted alpha/beta-hydrolase family hydrolase